MYNWQLKDWPNFVYNTDRLQQIAIAFAQEFGVVNGLVISLNDELKQEALLELLIVEALKTSEIEGEYMSREDVLSSIKNNLGLQEFAHLKDKRVPGISRLLVEANQSIGKPLTVDMICKWHKMLLQHEPKVNSGKWRSGTEPMEVISGAYGKTIVHYEAPPSEQVPVEMDNFVAWYTSIELPAKDDISNALLKSAIAHLYFESIHPFEDGNGRIGRTLAKFTLSQSLNSPVLLSLSKIIEKDRKLYYDQLKSAQRTLDITNWVNYFARVIVDAQKDAKEVVQFTLKKARFFDQFTAMLNERQLKVINRMFENGSAGFEGGMTAKKYMAITKTSKATATRDLQELHESGIFIQVGAGRGVRYHLAHLA